MKDNNFIRDAIDESLSGVRFTNQDMRAVLRKTRSREKERAPRRFEYAFALAALSLVLVPVALFTLRAHRTPTTSITAAPGISAAAPEADAPHTADDLRADRIVAPAAYTAEESEAIRIARACYEAVCDTAIFTFEEFTVEAVQSGDALYTVTMESIYGNGCRFTADVSLLSGSVVRYSTPQLATVPAYLNTDSPEVAAWYERYGKNLITWPQDAQAEFSRRYEGGLLRAALPGELNREQAEALATDALRGALPSLQDTPLFAYSMLYAERAGENCQAHYVVSVYADALTEPPPGLLGTVTLHTDGSSIQVIPE